VIFPCYFISIWKSTLKLAAITSMFIFRVFAVRSVPPFGTVYVQSVNRNFNI
jgi:hypothetical protein